MFNEFGSESDLESRAGGRRRRHYRGYRGHRGWHGSGWGYGAGVLTAAALANPYGPYGYYSPYATYPYGPFIGGGGASPVAAPRAAGFWDAPLRDPAPITVASFDSLTGGSKTKSKPKSKSKSKRSRSKSKGARRTVLRSKSGTKLYAKRRSDGTFADIQSYKRAHGLDIKLTSKAEKSKKRSASKKRSPSKKRSASKKPSKSKKRSASKKPSKPKKRSVVKKAKKVKKPKKAHKKKRTTHRSTSGTKLYAVRSADGKFADIQTYKRAHGLDIKLRAKDEK